MKNVPLLTLIAMLMACSVATKKQETSTYRDLKIVGAMKNVMWKGELGASIHLDTISDKIGLHAIGPLSFLKGELLVNNGKSYVSKVVDDSTMSVEESFDVSAPFLVYGNVTKWNEIDLPKKITDIKTLESYIQQQTKSAKKPFTFKLAGTIHHGTIHIQNLAPGSKVSSPEEAHRGQVNYPLTAQEVEIIGFFSTEHQGVFTHHDSFVHLHLITKDKTKMGHLDDVEFNTMKLFLPLS